MKQENLIAGALVAFCAIAAVGSWFSSHPKEKETTSTQLTAPIFGKSSIAQLDIEGMIVDSGSGGGLGSGGSASAQQLLKAIHRIREDKVPVVLLNINSPGGTASASQSVFEELMRLKRETKTKIVATMGDMAASGGYYIASAADSIVANPSTLTGSIGVIIHTQNVQGLMGKLGVQNTVIKSGAHKDLLSPFRPTTPDERAMLQSIVNDTYQQFLEAVSTGRRMPMNQLKPLADGRIFTGRQAQKVKLVDKLGNYSVAVDEARRLGNLDASVQPKNYSEGNWRDFFSSFTAKANPFSQALSPQLLLETGALNKVPLMLYE